MIATLEELTRHEAARREETEDGAQLVLPSAFRRDLPSAAEPSGDRVEFGFEGPVGNVYATLVVRLSRRNRFTRRGRWQPAAQFEADSGGLCTVHLVRADEGHGAIQVGFDTDIAQLVRFSSSASWPTSGAARHRARSSGNAGTPAGLRDLLQRRTGRKPE